MSPWVISLGAGVVIGLFYALLNVRSPAPPAVALVGLLGMIIGGQLMAQVVGKTNTVSVSIQAAAPLSVAAQPVSLPLRRGEAG